MVLLEIQSSRTSTRRSLFTKVLQMNNSYMRGAKGKSNVKILNRQSRYILSIIVGLVLGSL